MLLAVNADQNAQEVTARKPDHCRLQLYTLVLNTSLWQQILTAEGRGAAAAAGHQSIANQPAAQPAAYSFESPSKQVHSPSGTACRRLPPCGGQHETGTTSAQWQTACKGTQPAGNIAAVSIHFTARASVKGVTVPPSKQARGTACCSLQCCLHEVQASQTLHFERTSAQRQAACQRQPAQQPPVECCKDGKHTL
jgi:hypothetical protein